MSRAAVVLWAPPFGLITTTVRGPSMLRWTLATASRSCCSVAPGAGAMTPPVSRRTVPRQPTSAGPGGEDRRVASRSPKVGRPAAAGPAVAGIAVGGPAVGGPAPDAGPASGSAANRSAEASTPSAASGAAGASTTGVATSAKGTAKPGTSMGGGCHNRGRPASGPPVPRIDTLRGWPASAPTSGPASSTASSTGGSTCLLYTSDAADDLLCVDLGG